MDLGYKTLDLGTYYLVAPVFCYYAVNPQLVARFYGLAKLNLVRAHKEGQFVRAVNPFEHQHAGRLRHGLQLEDAGHDRISRKVPLEKRLVYGNILYGYDLVVV